MANREVIKRWVDALRTGEYKQVKHKLKAYRPDGEIGYCCLGVLCEMAVKDGLVDESKRVSIGYDGVGNTRPGDYFRYHMAGEGEQMTAFPSDALKEWIGLDDWSVSKETAGITGDDYPTVGFAGLNDDYNWSFEQIADANEKEYLTEKEVDAQPNPSVTA